MSSDNRVTTRNYLNKSNQSTDYGSMVHDKQIPYKGMILKSEFFLNPNLRCMSESHMCASPLSQKQIKFTLLSEKYEILFANVWHLLMVKDTKFQKRGKAQIELVSIYGRTDNKGTMFKPLKKKIRKLFPDSRAYQATLKEMPLPIALKNNQLDFLVNNNMI